MNDEIDNERPPILKLAKYDSLGKVTATHFVVAKGIDGSKVSINDPANTNEYLDETEDELNMSINNVGRFKKTNTDLSYIVLVVNPDVDLKVYDLYGNQITEGYSIDGPYINPEEPTEQVETSPVLTFYYPKPESGKYKVVISADNKEYLLDAYLYDVNGAASVTQISSTIPNGEDVLLLNIDKTNSERTFAETVTFDTILSKLDHVDESSLITNHGVYTSVRNAIEHAKNQYSKGNIFQSRAFLVLAQTKLEFFSPRFIDESFASDIIAFIDILANSLK